MDLLETGSQEINSLTAKIIGCAIEIHRNLGPGLLESAYERCLSFELDTCGIPYKNQVTTPYTYKGIELGSVYRIDFLVEGTVILELKSVEQVLQIHEAQLLTYMRLAKIPVGLLINFNVPIIKRGIKRFSL